MAKYTTALQQLIVDEIQLEFQASHTYRAYASFFSHPEVSYPGFAKFFREEAEDELKHADAFIKYHQDRGGFVILPTVNGVDNRISPVNALRKSIELEYIVLNNLERINEIADIQTQVFIQDYIIIQTNSIAKLTALLTKASRVENDNVGLYLIDKELQ